MYKHIIHLDMFLIKCFLYCRNAWHLIQLKEYPPMAPWITHTSKTWRGTRTACIPTCHPPRAPRSWTQPEVPQGCHELVIEACWQLTSALSKPCGAVQECWLWAFQLPASGWVLLHQGHHLVYCSEINARVIAALCSFTCLSVCLFQEPGKLPEEEKLLTNCAAVSFSSLECCQCGMGNPGPAELWCHLSAAAGPALVLVSVCEREIPDLVKCYFL